jgi:hypothetical protein
VRAARGLIFPLPRRSGVYSNFPRWRQEKDWDWKLEIGNWKLLIVK